MEQLDFFSSTQLLIVNMVKMMFKNNLLKHDLLVVHVFFFLG